MTEAVAGPWEVVDWLDLPPKADDDENDVVQNGSVENARRESNSSPDYRLCA